MKTKLLDDGSAWARINYLDVTESGDFFAKLMYKKYPKLKNKKVILYDFDLTSNEGWQELCLRLKRESGRNFVCRHEVVIRDTETLHFVVNNQLYKTFKEGRYGNIVEEYRNNIRINYDNNYHLNIENYIKIT